jgi:hypothetical protein
MDTEQRSFELIAEIDELAASMKCEIHEIADREIMPELRRITGWTIDDVGEVVKLRRAIRFARRSRISDQAVTFPARFRRVPVRFAVRRCRGEN